MSAILMPLRQRVPVNMLMADPGQPRRKFDEDLLRGLSESMKADGQIHPIIVRPRPEAPEQGENYGIEQPKYWIIDGERRWRAALLGQIPEVDIEIRPFRATSFPAQKAELRSVQLVANLQREGLTLPEECAGIAKFLRAIEDELVESKRQNESALEIAALRLGKSKSWISKRAGVERMRPEIRELMVEGLVGDIEILHGLERLAELDPAEYNEIIEGLHEYGGNTADEEIVSRNHIRELVRRAQEAAEAAARSEDQEREPDLFTVPEEQSAGGAPEAAELEHRPGPAGADAITAGAPSQMPAEQAASPPAMSPAASAENARRTLLAQLAPAVREFEAQASARLCQAFGLAHNAAQPFSGELNVYSARMISESSPILPPSALRNDYNVALRGELDKLEPAIRALIRGQNGEPARLSCTLSLTLAEALAVQKAMRRPLMVEARDEMLGTTIERVIEQRQKRSPRAPKPRSAGKAVKQAATASASDAGPKSTQAVKDFLKACTQKKTKSRIQCSALHEAYVAYCKRHGLEPVGIAHPSFTMPITLAGIQRVKSNGVRYYVDIQLLVEGE